MPPLPKISQEIKLNKAKLLTFINYLSDCHLVFGFEHGKVLILDI